MATLLKTVALASILAASVMLTWLAIYFPEFEADRLSFDQLVDGVPFGPPSNSSVPKTVHQILVTDIYDQVITMPEAWQSQREHCQAVNPDYEFRLWGREDLEALLRANHPWLMPTYNGYKYPIQKLDVARLVVLHEHGGVYLDLDVDCQHNLAPLLQYPVVLSQTQPFGLANDFLQMAPRHPFTQFVLERLVTSAGSYGLPLLTVLFGTGPNFLSRAYTKFQKTHASGDIKVMPPDVSGLHCKRQQRSAHTFFQQQGSAATWNGQDAKVLQFVVRHWQVELVAAITTLACRRLYQLWTPTASSVQLPL